MNGLNGRLHPFYFCLIAAIGLSSSFIHCLRARNWDSLPPCCDLQITSMNPGDIDSHRMLYSDEMPESVFRISGGNLGPADGSLPQVNRNTFSDWFLASSVPLSLQ